MLNNIIRLIIAGILLLGSIFLFINSFIGLGVLAVLLSGLFVLTYFKNEKNLIAFYFLRKNKFQSAGKVLAGVKYPERMIKSQEAYYYYLSGLIHSQEHKNSVAEKQFKKALNIGLRMKTDKAVANLNLSGIYLSRRNKQLSKYYLQEAKSLDKQKMLSAQIKELEHMMKRI